MHHAMTANLTLAMAPIESGPMGVLLLVALIALAVGMLLGVFRLMRGPTLPDRVIALDQLGFFAVGILCLSAIRTGKSALLSVSIVMALILFLGTCAFALYLERRARS